MTRENQVSTPKDDQTADCGRKPYAKPSLRFFGAVRSLTQGPGASANEAGGPDTGSFRPTGTPCERRIKTRIVRVGSHPLGIGLYLFDYRPEFRASCGNGRQFGVMVDEVERVLPAAVSVRADGLKAVDYEMLGIRRGLH